jgi:hypothetical protein
MSSCEWTGISAAEARAWVQAHKHELPVTLAQLAELPIPIRKAIVAEVSGEQRAAFWREHFLRFVGPNSTLRADQQAFIRQALEELPALHAVDDPTWRARASAFEQRIAQCFSRDEARRIFRTLGPEDQPSTRTDFGA